MTFRLAHISDVHLGPLPGVKRRELLSKRITGYINWHRNRADKMDDSALVALISHMKSSAPDHIAVTGDLVNLALDEEIHLARQWLDSLGRPEDVSVVPGNHDTYVPGALANISRAWRPYMLGDNPPVAPLFPYRRDRGQVALIGSNSGRATLPFLATGSFKEKQARILREMLRRAKKDGLFRVVMIHHPPFKGATSAAKRLVGAARFRKVIKMAGAELILHGHTHINSFKWIDGPTGSVPVVGVPSASHHPVLQDEKLKHRSHKPSARYNLFEIEGKPDKWSCLMREFGFEVTKSSQIKELEKREIYRDGRPLT